MEEIKKPMGGGLEESSSFRDPDARVFYQDGEVYRKINPKYIKTYKKFMDSGLYKKLASNGLIVEHKEIKICEDEIIIKPEQVFISYPWEWCFSELKDAALATLEIQKTALEFDMTLKDATPFNIQFLDNKPVLIDTSSFEEFKEKPWAAYRQFCENFLAPLALIAYTDLNLGSLLLGNINGLSLELTSKLLPVSAKFNLGLFAHIFIHSKMQDKYSENKTEVKAGMSKKQVLNIIDNLYDTVLSIKLYKYKTEWGEYYSNTNYTDDSFKAKKDIIDNFRCKIQPKTVWDFGCNTGIFSRIFSDNGSKVTAFDIDKLAIERNYNEVKANGEKNIFPLVFDIANPSPALGFDNSERKTLKERVKNLKGGVDLTLALALIHHLRITYSIPFNRIAKYFSEISKHLIIEFVDKKDSKIQTMLLNREDIFDDYTKENFENSFKEFYNIAEIKPIPDTKRTLYLMEKKQ